jgi:hypothetical protein
VCKQPFEINRDLEEPMAYLVDELKSERYSK